MTLDEQIQSAKENIAIALRYSSFRESAKWSKILKQLEKQKKKAAK